MKAEDCRTRTFFQKREMKIYSSFKWLKSQNNYALFSTTINPFRLFKNLTRKIGPSSKQKQRKRSISNTLDILTPSAKELSFVFVFCQPFVTFSLFSSNLIMKTALKGLENHKSDVEAAKNANHSQNILICMVIFVG